MLMWLALYPLRHKQLSLPLKSLPSSWDWKTNNLKAKSVVMPPHPFVYLSFFWVGDVHKFENIYFLAFYRKGFLTPALKSHSTWFLDCEVKFGPLLVHFLGF